MIVCALAQYFGPSSAVRDNGNGDRRRLTRADAANGNGFLRSWGGSACGWSARGFAQALGIVLVWGSLAAPAAAQSSARRPPPTPASVHELQEQPTARLLFDDARALMQMGEYGEACPKLEAASKMFPGSGVLLNLGDCYEHIGRTASAFAAFGAAALAATRLNRPRS